MYRRLLARACAPQRQAPQSKSEQLAAAAGQSTLSRAQALLQEEKDEVKHMNQMVRYAKCVSVREQQVQEKQAALLAEQEEQRRLDLMMEIERIRALEVYQVRRLPDLLP